MTILMELVLSGKASKPKMAFFFGLFVTYRFCPLKISTRFEERSWAGTILSPFVHPRSGLHNPSLSERFDVSHRGTHGITLSFIYLKCPDETD